MATGDDRTHSNLTTVAPPPIFIDTATLRSILTYKNLISHFQASLPTASSTIQSPIRQSHETSPTSSLLLMPSWSLSPSLPYIGVKLVTHYPQNSSLNLPGINASYVLFNSLTGQTLASMDGTELTLYRTSCVSALASLYLSREDSQVLVMIGAGSLAPHLIKAHLAARPGINRVIIWNRSAAKARLLVEKMRNEVEHSGICFEISECLEEAVGAADIVSCATNSETPLVMGAALKAGAHLDLVGSFKHSMRECDDEAIRRGRVFVDNDAAVVEAGELVGAFERGVISPNEIGGKLVELIEEGHKKKKKKVVGRRDLKEITVFKSVGSAVVDILSAQLVYETFMNHHVHS